jgi:hypothetical protein
MEAIEQTPPSTSVDRVTISIDAEATAADSGCYRFHTTFINSSGHFPFGWLKIDFIITVIMIPLARSTSPFNSGCLTDAKCIFVPIWSQKALNVSASNWVLLSTVMAFGTPKRQTIFC